MKYRGKTCIDRPETPANACALLMEMFIVSVYLLCMANCLAAQELLPRDFGENGEVYVLISEGEAGGIWAMNNLTEGTFGQGIPEIIVNPTGVTDTSWAPTDTSVRGLKVDPERMVFYFRVMANPDFELLPGKIRVRINTVSTHRGYHRTTHNWHDLTRYNHYGHFDPEEHPGNWQSWRRRTRARVPAVAATMPAGYVPYGYSPDDVDHPDCSSGWYWVPNRAAYHSFVRSVTGDWFGRQAGTNTEDAVADPGASYYIFGETHYNKQTRYHLMNWMDILDERRERFQDQDTILGDGALKAKTSDLYVRRIHVNGCHDGCTGGYNSSEFTSTPWLTEVVVSMSGNDYLYKRHVGMADGLLRKNDGAGVIPDDTVIGYRDELSTRHLAVSSRDHETDWIYLLGDQVVREWMEAEGMSSAGAAVDEVAVSDQWWQDGGIVYALDRSAGKVYKFRRDERYLEHGLPEEIPVPATTDSIGTDGYGNLFYAVPEMTPPDPQHFIADFCERGGHIESISWSVMHDGAAAGMATFRQEVSKTVYRFGYVSRSVAEIGRLVVGYNQYTRLVIIDDLQDGENPDLCPDRWVWTDTYRLATSVDERVRTEITAINYAVAPKVDGYRPARLDIEGPFHPNSLTGELRPFPTTVWSGYKEGELYLFGAENYPVPDLNIENERFADRALNINSGEGPDAEGLNNTSLAHCLANPVDNDDDGLISSPADYYNNKVSFDGSPAADWKGGFPSTLDFRTLRYRWSIYQFKDRYGVDVTRDLDGDGISDGPRKIFDSSANPSLEYGWQRWPFIGVCLDGGQYELRLESKYHWFNYDVLPRGSLACDRYTHLGVYVPPAGEESERAVASDGTTVARYRFHVQSQVEQEIVQPGQIVCLDVEPHEGEEPPPEPLKLNDYWVIDEDRNVLWELRETEGVADSESRIVAMLADRPPMPEGMDPDKVINLSWQGGVKFQITLDLVYPMSPAGPRSGQPAIPSLNLTREGINDQALSESQRRAMEERLGDVRLASGVDDETTMINEATIFETPSDPYRYRLTMRATRFYSYQAYMLVDTGNGVLLQQPVPYVRKIEIEAATDVLVRDTTPPRLVAAVPGNSLSIGRSYIVYASTGSPITLAPEQVDADYPPPAANPEFMAVFLEDNNPFDAYPGTVEGGYANQGDVLSSAHAGSNRTAVSRYIREWNRDRYASLHTQNRYARMSYEAYAVEEISDQDSSVLKRYELPNKCILESQESRYDSRFSDQVVFTVDEFSGVMQFIPQPEADRSYVRYTFDLTGVGPLSRLPLTEGDDPGAPRDYQWENRFCLNYASNHPNWRSPGMYASFSDASGNTLQNIKLAEIVIRDNVQPNPIVAMEVTGRETGRNILPGNLSPDSYSRNIRVHDHISDTWATRNSSRFTFFNNGDWYPGPVDKTAQPWMYWVDTDPLGTYPWGGTAPPFPVDPVPVTFQPVPERTRISLSGRFATDNISGPSTVTFLYTIRSTEGNELEQVDDGVGEYQFVFYESDDFSSGGCHVLEGTIEDDALGWDCVTRKPNVRRFRYFLPVYRTRVKRYVLQSSSSFPSGE